MKKTIFSIPFLLFFLAFNSAGAQILQPVNANKVSVTVVNNSKFFDSGGEFGDYKNCQALIDNALNCTSSLTLCAQGIVCIKFNAFVLAAGEADLLIIKSGNKVIASSANGDLAGLTFTSDDPSGCLTVEFHATSILSAAGWDADIIVKPGISRVPSGGCNLVCIGSVNASMPSAPGVCNRTLTYLDLLSNPNCTGYVVSLSYPFGTNANQPAGQVDKSQIGYTFIYSVIDPRLQNSCWGYVTIEDKAGPQLLCANRRASCAQIEALTSNLGNIVDNCAVGAQLLQNVTFVPLGDGCNDPRGIALVYREIIGFDTWGNTSTCRDTITIFRNRLSDIVCPSLVTLECKQTCGNPSKMVIWDQYAPKNDLFVANGTTQTLYPTPENLVRAQAYSYCFIPKDTLVVPHIRDSVYTVTFPNGVPTITGTSQLVPFYKSAAGVCKLTVGYSDEVFQLCPATGSSYKIRRQWRIVDWCQNGKDTVCIQYIKVEDKQPPVLTPPTGTPIVAVTNPHDCFADINLDTFRVSDCSPYDQYYTIRKIDPITGKVTVLTGLISSNNPSKRSTINRRIRLSSNPYHNGPNAGCDTVRIRVTDNCLNTATGFYLVCVYDDTPPTPVCDEFTVTTVDPATCWARVYAKDLDNGSRDNCCNVLHFAVATMANIDAEKKKWIDYWNANCKADYWKYLDVNRTKGKYLGYTGFLEDYLNCFVFADYIDLTECGDNLVVLRVYEACGVPRYDPHVFPCSEHDWFTYNSFGMCRRVHNYSFFTTDGKKSCDDTIPVGCRADIISWATGRNNKLSYPLANPDPGKIDLYGAYFGSIPFGSYCGPVRTEFTEYFPKQSSMDVSDNYNYAPGNRCSDKRLYNDCMVNVHVDDKTPPVCEGIKDLFYYCDGVYDVRENDFPDYRSEYAHLACYYPDRGPSGFPDYSCTDRFDRPYKNVELKSENEINENVGTVTADYSDPTGK
ncbi:MAG: hypothetical protein ABIR66_12380, partial [Saprospiraceae bacterium]